MNSTAEFAVLRRGKDPSGPVDGSYAAVCEEPFTVRLAGHDNVTMMRTPGHDRELAVGFLFTEGLIDSVTDIHLLCECAENPDVMDVRVAERQTPRVRRNLIVSSSCGLCGRPDIREMIAAMPRIDRDARIAPAILEQVAAKLRDEQPLFRATGATHAAALFAEDGGLLAVREDVGRHNAVDKVLGWALMRNALPRACGLFLSGRTSLELVLKAARAGLPVLASVSAPTATAIEAARAIGLTLCGFVRGAEMTVFAQPDRIEYCI